MVLSCTSLEHRRLKVTDQAYSSGHVHFTRDTPSGILLVVPCTSCTRCLSATLAEEAVVSYGRPNRRRRRPRIQREPRR